MIINFKIFESVNYRGHPSIEPKNSPNVGDWVIIDPDSNSLNWMKGYKKMLATVRQPINWI